MVCTTNFKPEDRRGFAGLARGRLERIGQKVFDAPRLFSWTHGGAIRRLRDPRLAVGGSATGILSKGCCTSPFGSASATGDTSCLAFDTKVLISRKVSLKPSRLVSNLFCRSARIACTSSNRFLAFLCFKGTPNFLQDTPVCAEQGVRSAVHVYNICPTELRAREHSPLFLLTFGLQLLFAMTSGFAAEGRSACVIYSRPHGS
jgi:hypothetical protein